MSFEGFIEAFIERSFYYYIKILEFFLSPLTNVDPTPENIENTSFGFFIAIILLVPLILMSLFIVSSMSASLPSVSDWRVE